MVLSELARAKINLTLRVRGKLPSGYHALESLVVFADFGDEITLTADVPLSVTARGPFSDAITGENLVARAAAAAATAFPGLRTGRFEIAKHIPVAAGLGGGSADAAGALRLLARLNPGAATDEDWGRVAATIGADVPVCLANRTAMVSGFGDRLSGEIPLPALWCVLVNAQSPVPADKTRRVFAALVAPPIDIAPPPPGPPDTGRFLAWLDACDNDLQAPAQAVLPDMSMISRALAGQPGCRLVRMSGAGPTWFAIFDEKSQAEAAARSVADRHPGWWIRATGLGRP